MKDSECVGFLQWALPRLGLRWRGFRKIRSQVCERVDRRMRALGIDEAEAYKAYLASHSDEWPVLDGFCTISISRFYRDHAVFDALGDTVLPALAAQAATRTDATVHCWSAGCASGEEPYTLSLIWNQRIRLQFPHVVLAVVATDLDATLLDRARAACYSQSSLRELPPAWRGSTPRSFGRTTITVFGTPGSPASNFCSRTSGPINPRGHSTWCSVETWRLPTSTRLRSGAWSHGWPSRWVQMGSWL